MQATPEPATDPRSAASPWLPVLLAALLWAGLVNQLRVEWSINLQYSFGWGVPFMALYLFWKRWPDRPDATPAPGKVLWAVLGVLLAMLFPLRLLQEANPDWRLVSWIYALVVVSSSVLLVLRTGGTSWLKHFILPVLFILVAVPWPTPLEQAVIQGLMRGVAAVTVEVMNWLGVPAIQRGNLIQLPNNQIVGVSEACSGVRSFQATLMASLFLGELYRFGFIARVALFLGGVTSALFLNICRSLLLTWVNVRGGKQSFDKWHDPAGYVVLGISFAVLWVIASLMTRRHGRSIVEEAEAPTRVVPTHPFPNLLMCGALGWLVTVEVANEAWYRIHESQVQRQPSWTVNWPGERDGFKMTTIPEESRLLLRYSKGQGGEWRREDGSVWMMYFFEWSPGRAAAQLARNHTPETCLPAGGLEIRDDYGIETFEAAGLVIPFHRYLFDYHGRPCQVFFCLWEDKLKLRGGLGDDFSRFSRFQAVLRGERQLGQRVLEVAMVGEGDKLTARTKMEEYLKQQLVQESVKKP